jgi:Skp family chaperone for outer membrane proteins
MLATGMAVLSGAIYLGSTLSAQQPTGPQAQPPAAVPAPQTKIALINLNYVVKNYAKFIALQGEMKGVLTEYQNKDKTLATQFEAKTKEQQTPGLAPAAKDKIDVELLNLKHAREDNSAAGKKVLADKSDAGMVTLYIEVANAAKLYAVPRGIELVMHYNDALDQSEMWSAPNIARKLQAGACIPLYYQPGMDISPQVVQMLNQSYQAGLHPPAAAGTSAPPPSH